VRVGRRADFVSLSRTVSPLRSAARSVINAAKRRRDLNRDPNRIIVERGGTRYRVGVTYTIRAGGGIRAGGPYAIKFFQAIVSSSINRNVREIVARFPRKIIKCDYHLELHKYLSIFHT